ncbi:fructosamine kinase family protein [Sulfuriferula plumbiphila]|uniref:Fructosamine kinase family protein n=1 Tax=Sulfuriferula plumbiphila TaxID=171865 RepID=A0A512L3L6_9PROT|nr:fructosamine kinase family protein [Sulfuriferula plumbiphila]BBP02771.1 fructosamine kinase family protein [Sulfuriferula plumbiphila]GEP29065.1 fructosamine kinase family protein [Sulfuriferula plumbiphila]
MSLWKSVAQGIQAATGAAFPIQRTTPVGGGCINAAWCIESGTTRYFVKTNSAAKLPMFEAEAAGLAALAASHTLRVPHPVSSGVAGNEAFLVLEWLDLDGHGSAAQLGQQLAALHRTSAPRFGFASDNTIGATPQHNPWTDNWIDFWRDQRLGFQLELAARNGFGGSLQSQGERLMGKFAGLFDGYQPQPSLLHGDLWSGNYGYTQAGEPVIFDPAVYYGDREADIAMTELFGGFPADFYSAYREAWPLDAGYSVRKNLYNLYHILNHANLFGGSYARQAEGMMERLLRELA